MFEQIIEEATNRFDLGKNAPNLVRTLITSILDKDTDGLNGFLTRFKRQGLQPLLDSWLQDSAPLSINHVQIEEVLSGQNNVLEKLISQTSLDKSTVLRSLAFLLPALLKLLSQKGESSPDVLSYLNPGVATAAAVSVAASSVPPTPAAPSSPPNPILPTETVAAKPINPIGYESRVTPWTEAVEDEAGLWKPLLWLIPICLGAILLFSVTGKKQPTTDTPVTNEETSPVTQAPATPAPASQVAPEATAPPATEPANTAPASTPASPTEPAASPTPTAPEPAKTDAPTQPPSATPAEPASNTASGTLSSESVAQAPATNEAKTAETPSLAVLPSAKIYFAVSKTVLPVDTAAKIAPVVAYLKANPNSKVTISGFHDATGNQAANEAIAKLRATNVQKKLLKQGVAKEAIVLEKPQSTVGTGNLEEARRVEVTITQ